MKRKFLTRASSFLLVICIILSSISVFSFCQSMEKPDQETKESSNNSGVLTTIIGAITPIVDKILNLIFPKKQNKVTKGEAKAALRKLQNQMDKNFDKVRIDINLISNWRRVISQLWVMKTLFEELCVLQDNLSYIDLVWAKKRYINNIETISAQAKIIQDIEFIDFPRDDREKLLYLQKDLIINILRIKNSLEAIKDVTNRTEIEKALRNAPINYVIYEIKVRLDDINRCHESFQISLEKDHLEFARKVFSTDRFSTGASFVPGHIALFPHVNAKFYKSISEAEKNKIPLEKIGDELKYKK